MPSELSKILEILPRFPLITRRYQMWITHNNETEKILIPVMPEKYSVKNGSLDKKVTISGLGEIIIKGEAPALILEFQSFFPAHPFPGLEELVISPAWYVEKLTQWKNSDIPVHFLITGTPINFYCFIQDFPWEEKSPDTGSIYYKMVLAEFRDTKARQIKIEGSKAILPGSAASRVDNRVTPKTYTVIKGDYLYKIARKVLGDEKRWKEIFDLNRDIIKNKDLIYPGQVLKMP